MIFLDSDHFTALAMPGHSRQEMLLRRLASQTDNDICLPIITVEESLRGWLAAIHKAKSYEKQILLYEKLVNLISILGA